MTLHLTTVIGNIHDAEFRGRDVQTVLVAWDEATKPRLRRVTTKGRDVVIDTGRGGYLIHGAVLQDDGETVIVIERPLENALVVRFDSSASAHDLVTDAVRLGHAFGNQHVPLDPQGLVIAVPLTTSAEISLQTVQELGLQTVTTAIEEVRLAQAAPLGARTGTHSHNAEADMEGHG